MARQEVTSVNLTSKVYIGAREYCALSVMLHVSIIVRVGVHIGIKDVTTSSLFFSLIIRSLKLILFIIQDEFASLPAVVPNGPIAIFGLVIRCYSY